MNKTCVDVLMTCRFPWAIAGDTGVCVWVTWWHRSSLSGRPTGHLLPGTVPDPVWFRVHLFSRCLAYSWCPEVFVILLFSPWPPFAPLSFPVPSPNPRWSPLTEGRDN